MPNTKSRFFVLLLVAVLIAGQFLAFQTLLAQGLLPDPIAIHWGFSGEPDGFADAGSYLLGITATYLALLALLAYFGFGLKRRLLTPLLFGVVGFLFGFLFLIFSITTLIQVGRTAPESDLAPWLLVLLLVLPLSLVFLALGSPKVVLADLLRIEIRGFAVLKLDYAELESVETTQLRARDFGGLGVRYGNRTLAFIPSPGAGVLIKTSFGESVAIRSKNPEILVSALKAKIGQ